MARAYIGLGSNVGDRRAHLIAAIEGLDSIGTLVAASPIYETRPVGPVDQNPFENAVAAIDTGLSPLDLLDASLAIEQTRGRVRVERWGPRTLDLDILWYDNQAIAEPGLTIPHPRIRDRRFVLAPLVYLAPRLADDGGAYASSLPDVANQEVRRITGPLDVSSRRWRCGLGEGLDMQPAEHGYSIDLAHDWVNRSGAMFGGYLGSAILLAGEREHPEKVPTTMTYRYVKPVPEGERAHLRVVHERRSERSALMSVTIELHDEIYGAAHLSVVADRGDVVVGAPMPQVLPIAECVPVDEIITSHGGEPGNSVESWRPLERWDVPDLVDGTDNLFRAWCPNPVEGSSSAYASAASMFMPIDALIWPAAMQAADRLGPGQPMFTPTVEITARFADTSHNGGWLLGEASVDHMSSKSVAGTVKVWSDDGVHAATGHSLNLTIG